MKIVTNAWAASENAARTIETASLEDAVRLCIGMSLEKLRMRGVKVLTISDSYLLLFFPNGSTVSFAEANW